PLYPFSENSLMAVRRMRSRVPSGGGATFFNIARTSACGLNCNRNLFSNRFSPQGPRREPRILDPRRGCKRFGSMARSLCDLDHCSPMCPGSHSPHRIWTAGSMPRRSGQGGMNMRFLFAAVSAATLLMSVNAAQADKRVAFVVGNGAYKNVAALPNPAVD